MKGFKKDGKFRPTEKQSSGISSSQIRSKKSVIPSTGKASEIREKKSKGLKLPEYQSDEWNKLKSKTSERFDSEFNSVRFENLTIVEPNWFEYINYHEPSHEDIMDHFGEGNKTWKQFEKDHTESEIDDAIDELRHEQEEIIWGTLFEAKNEFVADKIRDNVDAVGELGLTVIDLGDAESSNNYETGVFLGVRSAGHDFYESYWVPLFRSFNWV